MKYNKSEPYANTVLELSEALKGRLAEQKEGSSCGIEGE
jgi:membrane-bound lytic murein transglycosylase B